MKQSEYNTQSVHGTDGTTAGRQGSPTDAPAGTVAANTVAADVFAANTFASDDAAADTIAADALASDIPVADSVFVDTPAVRDTLSTADAIPVLKYTDAADMFGRRSTAVIQPASVPNVYGSKIGFASSAGNAVAGDPLFQSLLLAAFVVCIAVATTYKREIASLTGKMFGGRLSDDYATGRRHDIIPKQFLDTTLVFGIFVIALVVVRYIDACLPERLQAIGGHIVPLSVLRVLGVTVLCIAYQYAALKIIGRISRETEFIDELLYVKRACFAVSTTVATPVFILAALSVGRSAEVWFLTLAGICTVLALLFTKETLALFLVKKIPFLHWILYLCTVEAFPLTLICASIARCQ